MYLSNVETFIKRWWSSDRLDYRHEVREWMQTTYSQPVTFWEDLFSLIPSSTLLFEKYDFYTDCIVRHLEKDLIAFKSIDDEGNPKAWTYDHIHHLVNAQVELWVENHATQAGQTVTLIMPYGIHFIVSLLAALRLGLAVSILPMKDRFFTAANFHRALEHLKPHLVVTHGGLDISEKWNQLTLNLSLEKKSISMSESHKYEAGEIVQKHFNPYALENTITLIEATRTYLIPLRDALIALNLKRSTTWARPGSSPFLEEPCCMLMALLSGATIVDLPDLQSESIDVLGVSPFLYELWMKNPIPLDKVKFWYRNPLYGNDHSWKAFSELNHLQKALTCQLLIDKEKGGITLFSQPKTMQELSFMHPSLGSPWKLLKVGSMGEESVEGLGLFQVEPPLPIKPHLVIAQVSDEWTLSTSLLPLKEGVPYPIQQVEGYVKTLSFVLACLIMAERHPHHYIQKQMTLLVFIPPKQSHLLQSNKEEWTQAIHTLIRHQIGEAFIPDRVLFYSLYPKMTKGAPDRNWVENQYESGALFHKQNRSLYSSLNHLRQSIYEKIMYNPNP